MSDNDKLGVVDLKAVLEHREENLVGLEYRQRDLKGRITRLKAEIALIEIKIRKEEQT